MLAQARAIFICLLFCSLLSAPLFSQSPAEDAELYGMVKQIQKNIEHVAQRNPFRFSAMNESLDKMSQASRLIRVFDTGREPLLPDGSLMTVSPLSVTEEQVRFDDVQRVLGLLEESEQLYEENHFASLLRAMIVEKEMGEDASNVLFEEFLQKSQTYSKFDERVLKWEHFQQVRRSVLELLEYRGINFQGREEQIQTIIPFEDLMNFMTHPEPKDVFLNFLLLGLILFGGLLLIGFVFMGVSFSTPYAASLPFIYLFVWVAYIFWIVDLAFGLPLGLNRHIVAVFILGFSGVFWAVQVIRGLWERYHPNLEDGYRLCPHCREAIPKLTKQCFQCGREIH